MEGGGKEDTKSAGGRGCMNKLDGRLNERGVERDCMWVNEAQRCYGGFVTFISIVKEPRQNDKIDAWPADAGGPAASAMICAKMAKWTPGPRMRPGPPHPR